MLLSSFLSFLSFSNCDDKSSHLSSSPTQYSREPVLREFNVSKIAVVFGPANIPFVARPSQEAFNVHFSVWLICNFQSDHLGGGIVHLVGGLGHLGHFSISNSDQLITDVLRLRPRCSTYRGHCKGSNRWDLPYLWKSAKSFFWIDLIWRWHLGCPRAAGRHSWFQCWYSVGRPTLQFSISTMRLFLKSSENLNSVLLSIWICPDTVLQLPVRLVVLWLVVLKRNDEAGIESTRCSIIAIIDSHDIYKRDSLY